MHHRRWLCRRFGLAATGSTFGRWACTRSLGRVDKFGRSKITPKPRFARRLLSVDAALCYVRAMLIRQEQQSDHAAIAHITAAAFADMEHSDQSEPLIIEKLRAADALTISLVAIEDDKLIGHVAFSPITIDNAFVNWFGLGPVSVEPSHQGKGIGSALIRQGLDQLRSRGAAGCVVLGDPTYYLRFGFERDDRLRYEDAPPEYFMRISLTTTEKPTGRVEYAPAFTG